MEIDLLAIEQTQDCDSTQARAGVKKAEAEAVGRRSAPARPLRVEQARCRLWQPRWARGHRHVGLAKTLKLNWWGFWSRSEGARGATECGAEIISVGCTFIKSFLGDDAACRLAGGGNDTATPSSVSRR